MMQFFFFFSCVSYINSLQIRVDNDTDIHFYPAYACTGVLLERDLEQSVRLANNTSVIRAARDVFYKQRCPHVGRQAVQQVSLQKILLE